MRSKRERSLLAVPDVDADTGIARVLAGMSALPFCARLLAQLRVAFIERSPESLDFV
jgi:hypothetical protein